MEPLTSKTTPQSILKEGVRRNARGIAAFVENAALAEKSFSPDCLRGKAFTVSGPLTSPGSPMPKGMSRDRYTSAGRCATPGPPTAISIR